ncbi:MAG: rRNA maturation RNase YbeY [Moraxella sp.]|jgi:probable rRNA maturation factor
MNHNHLADISHFEDTAAVLTDGDTMGFGNGNDNSNDLVVSFADGLVSQANFAAIEALYQPATIGNILGKVVTYLQQHPAIAIDSPLATHLFDKPLSLEVYVTEPIEAQAINLEARGKDYATNILSYPCELPSSVLDLLPALPLGELVICHAVVANQAAEQGKSVSEHLTHLLVHGILHVLGFDHELGQAQQDEMERIEIAVLASLSIANPYE